MKMKNFNINFSLRIPPVGSTVNYFPQIIINIDDNYVTVLTNLFSKIPVMEEHYRPIGLVRTMLANSGWLVEIEPDGDELEFHYPGDNIRTARTHHKFKWVVEGVTRDYISTLECFTRLVKEYKYDELPYKVTVLDYPEFIDDAKIIEGVPICVHKLFSINEKKPSN